MYLDFFLSMYLCLGGFMLIILMYKHMLIMLIILELVILNISLFMFMMMSLVGMEMFMIYYMVFSVCESVLGLALLVLIMRFSGNDYFFMINMSKF